MVLLIALWLGLSGWMERRSSASAGESGAEVADPPAAVPEWDGSPTSTLPNRIEQKVRGIQQAAEERDAQLRSMME